MAFTSFPASTPPTPITSLTEKVTPIGTDEIQISDSEDGDSTKKVQLSNLPYPPSAGGSPTGSVIPFAGTVAPADHLFCEGAIVSRTTYADLYAVIGDAFGSGDGVTTFQLPDMRGVGIRGTDSGKGLDPDAGARTASGAGGNIGDAIGSYQADSFGTHNHGMGIHFSANGNATSLNAQGMGFKSSDGSSWGTLTRTQANTAMIDDAGGSETRSKNIGMKYIIKT